MLLYPWDIRIIRTSLTVLAISGILASNVSAAEMVTIGGAGSGLGLMKILAESFEKSHPGTEIKILPSLGSSGGIKALLHGVLDVAIIVRDLKAEESKAGMIAVEYARTPFVFIVNNGVGKSDLTTDELEMIYTNKLLKWPSGARIRMIYRPISDTDTIILSNISKDMKQAIEDSNKRPYRTIATTDQDVVEMVAKIQNTIGGSTLTQIETEKPSVKVLSFNGIKPSTEALSTGTYPLVKPIYLVMMPKKSATAEQFVQFVRSAKGLAILEKSGALPAAGDKGIK